MVVGGENKRKLSENTVLHQDMPKTKAQMRPASKRRPTPRPVRRPTKPTFGAVSTINTAPVAIGNSMRGVKPQVIQTGADSVRVIGRDFAATCLSTGTATGWVPVAAIPLTPAAFESSVLRNYCQMYTKFKINAVRFHYITAAPTSTNGDVLFEVQGNRSDPCPNWTASKFLPYALSNPHTIIGPQWTNHTMEIAPKGPTRTLVPGSNTDIDYQAQGEVWLYSKTSSTMSPGYLIMDYDITFSEQGLNPRYRALPNADFMYRPIGLSAAATAKTLQSTAINLNASLDWVGGTAIPDFYSSSNETPAGIYKLVIDVTNTKFGNFTVSSGTAPTASTFATQQLIGSGFDTITMSDGFTCYLRVDASNNTALYTSITEALANRNALLWNQTFTPNTYASTNNVPTAGVWLFGLASLVVLDNADDLQHS